MCAAVYMQHAVNGQNVLVQYMNWYLISLCTRITNSSAVVCVVDISNAKKLVKHFFF